MSDLNSRPLGELIQIRKGKKPASVSPRKENEAQRPYLLIDSFGGEYKTFTDDASCPYAKANETLLVWDGERCGLTSTGHEGYIGSTLAAIQSTSDDLQPNYLFHFLVGKQKEIRNSAEGTGVPHVSRRFLEDLEIKLPPLPEQKKIAEILSGIDCAIKVGSNMASKIADQYQGILCRVFGGNSSDIPPDGYFPLGDLGLDISDGNYSSKYPSANEFVERGIPFIRASNMIDGTIDDKDMRFISAAKHNEITKGHLKSGDILIANRGDIGKACRVPTRHIGSNINAQVVRINGGNRIDQSFLYHYFSSPFCQALIDELTTGTALKQLPIGNLMKLSIPIPDISVQAAIGGALDSMQRAIHEISEKSKKHSLLKQAVASDLLSGRKRVSV